jgi:apolipoprotein D and lipocalin family protein
MSRTLLILLLPCLLLTACSPMRDRPAGPPLQVVPHVDLERYSGTWYEIARYPNRFEKDCYGSRATYGLREDGSISILNECRTGSPQGSLRQAKGTARVVDPETNARLKVTFFWPFSGDYWILELGRDYEYAVVGHPKRKYLWILGRERTMDNATYQGILRRLETVHYYDISRIMRTSGQQEKQQ